MRRLPLLIALTALILALGGLGDGDRLTVRRALADAVGATADAARTLHGRFHDWRADRAAAGAAAQAGAAPPVSGSGRVLSGVYRPEDPGAAARLGEADFQGAAVRFSRGLDLRTTPHRIVPAGDGWSASGRRFFDIADVPAQAQIEIRGVAEATLASGVDIGCGPGLPPAWIAIIQRPDDLDLMLFQGAAPPGDGMADTAICGVWRYHAVR